MRLIEKREKPKALTPEQHASILEEICSISHQLIDLAIRTCDNAGNAEAVDVLTGAIDSMARRIGFMADTAANGIPGGISLAGGDPYFWMMPPRYFNEVGGGSHE